MNKLFATACGGLLIAALTAGFRAASVFGNGLWVTTDGGEHWSAAAYPGGSVMPLEIIDDRRNVTAPMN